MGWKLPRLRRQFPQAFSDPPERVIRRQNLSLFWIQSMVQLDDPSKQLSLTGILLVQVVAAMSCASSNIGYLAVVSYLAPESIKSKAQRFCTCFRTNTTPVETSRDTSLCSVAGEWDLIVSLGAGCNALHENWTASWLHPSSSIGTSPTLIFGLPLAKNKHGQAPAGRR